MRSKCHPVDLYAVFQPPGTNPSPKSAIRREAPTDGGGTATAITRVKQYHDRPLIPLRPSDSFSDYSKTLRRHRPQAHGMRSGEDSRGLRAQYAYRSTGPSRDARFLSPPRNARSSRPPGYHDHHHQPFCILRRTIFRWHTGRRHRRNILWDDPLNLSLHVNTRYPIQSPTRRGDSRTQTATAEPKW